MTREFGARIKFLRTQRGLSQADLAGTELSHSYISLIESGKRIPSDDALALIADRLGCEVEQLRSAAADTLHQSLELALAEAEWSLTGNPGSGPGSGDTSRAPDPAWDFTAIERRAEAAGLTALAMRARWGAARGLERQARFEQAVLLYDRTLRDLGRGTPGEPDRLEVIGALCRCAVELGEFERATELGAPLLRDFQDYGGAPAPVVVDIVCALVWASLQRGELAHARHLAATAVSDAELLRDPQQLTRAYRAASQAAHDSGHTADALMLIRKALTAIRSPQDELSLGHLLALHGAALLRAGEDGIPAAERELNRALSLLAGRGREREAARCCQELARCALARGDSEAAAEAATRAASLLTGAPPVERAGALLLHAAAQVVGEDGASARVGCDLAVELLGQADGRRRATALCWAEAAEVYAALGELERALDAWRRGFALLGSAGPLLPRPYALPPRLPPEHPRVPGRLHAPLLVRPAHGSRER
ncbi:helix-turn-helix domain-containing protein [Streptomyces virginiae]|uniref:helix-turn-helix domain-containing protein n=1 Tax=Streptomyces virginiae TaxID=1961 RepID=UPI0037245B05